MKTTDRVLEFLYDRGDGFFLLDELCAVASLSRERLDGVLQALGNHGYALEFSPAYGVRLVGPVKLNANLIERGLGTGCLGRSVICFDEVDSTNDVAMDSARQGDTDGLVVLAESQRLGRGRQGRKWISPPGANILMSVLLLEGAKSGLSREALTIGAGLGVAEGIEDACGLSCGLKWPNDVLLDGKKVAGILVETRRLPGGLVIVIGVGVNANASPPDDRVDSPATNLADRLAHSVERTEVIREILRRLDGWVAAIRNNRHLDQLGDAWMSRCGMINEHITVLSAGRRYEGRILDVSPLDGLVLCCDSGRNVTLPAESTTILK